MKTYGNLFNKTCSFENLHLAYLKARKSKRYRPYVLEFSYNLEENLLNLQKDLLNLTYQPGPYRQFIVCDSKKRLIKAPDFRDRVVHHALCNVIEPIFDKSFIFDNYACRKNKGVHRAIKKLEKFIKSLTTHLRERERERVGPAPEFIASNATFPNILKTLTIVFYPALLPRKSKTKKSFGWLIKLLKAIQPACPSAI
jgi:hypothetical protein